MEMLFIAISIFVIIITHNISIKAYIEYNIYKNIGKFQLKICGITIFKGDISLIAGYFNLWRKNRKVVQIKIDINDKNFKLIGDIGQYFAKKLYVSHINSNLEFYGTNPAVISVVAGNAVVLEGITRSIILSKSPDTTIDTDWDVGYIDNYIRFKIKVGAVVTMFDFIWAIIRAFFKRGSDGKTKH